MITMKTLALGKKEINLTKGKILSTLFIIALPLFLNYLLELAYTIYDTVVLSSTGIGDAGSVVLFTQIKTLLSSTGTAIIAAAIILMNSYLGRNDKIKARMVLTQLLYILSVFSIICGCIFIGFGKPILLLLKTPQSMINSSYSYYVATIVSFIIGLFTTIYSDMLTAKGQTKRVLIANAIVILVKIILSSIVVFSNIFSNIDSSYLVICTIIAQLTMLVPALYSFFSKKSELSIVIEKPHKKMIKKIIKLSLPIVLGSIFFNLTKVIINSMVVNAYGSYVLTFYGLEGIFFGLGVKFVLAIQNTSSAMIGQSMGAGNLDRVTSIYKKALFISIIVGLINFIIFYIFKEPISLFATGNNVEMASLLVDFMLIYALNCFASPILELVTAYMNSLRITKPRFVSDVLRTIVFRLPLLIYFINFTNIGYTSLAWVFSISNSLTCVIMLVVSIVISIKLKKKVVTHSKLLLPATREVVY